MAAKLLWPRRCLIVEGQRSFARPWLSFLVRSATHPKARESPFATVSLDNKEFGRGKWFAIPDDELMTANRGKLT